MSARRSPGAVRSRHEMRADRRNPLTVAQAEALLAQARAGGARDDDVLLSRSTFGYRTTMLAVEIDGGASGFGAGRALPGGGPHPAR